MQNNKYKNILLYLILAITAVLLPIHCKSRDIQKPNFVIVIIDALRQDHVGLYGYERDTTPNIDLFAQNALIFQNAIAQCPWTAPSVASLFSSLYPSVHGVITHMGGKATVLPDSLETFAEILQKNGYKTAAFVANDWITPDLGFAQGFDVFKEIKPIKNAKQKGKKIPVAEELNNQAFPWLEKNNDSPFFMYVHYMDAHGPYSAPSPYNALYKSAEDRQLTAYERERLSYLRVDKSIDQNNLHYYIDQYDGEIRYADYHVGELINKLKAYKLLENTVIVITADHGEAFFEHGFCDHGFGVYDEEIVVPLIIRIPENSIMEIKNKKILSESRVDLMDLPRTLLGINGTDFPYRVNGRNLFHLKKDMFRDHISFSEELSENMKGPPKIAMVKDNFKIIYSAFKQKVTKIFDLKADPKEKNNRIKIMEKKADEFQREIEEHLINSKSLKKELKIDKITTPLDKEKIEKLKSLGYF